MRKQSHQRSRGETVRNYFSHQSEYWDSLYSAPEGPEGFLKHELTRRKEIVFDSIEENKVAPLRSALDLGCGSGQYTAPLSQMGLDCYGADISEEMLTLAQQKLPPDSSVTWIHSDCRNVPLDDQSVDLILCVGVLEYLTDDQPALEEIRRLIRPNGLAIVTFPNTYKLRNLLNPYYYLIRVWTYHFKNNTSGTNDSLDYCKAIVRRYSYLKIRQLAKQSGFQTLALKGCAFGPFSLWKKDILPLKSSIKISDTLEHMSNRVLFRCLTCFANRWVIVLTPKNATEKTNKKVVL